jgi:hypothetical protein
MPLFIALVFSIGLPSQVLAPNADFERATCDTDATGAVVCGFGCLKAPDGHVTCAAEPGRRCALSTDGTVACSAPTGIQLRLPAVQAECITGADGFVRCGYACISDKAGNAHCADTADGACGLSTSGHARCTRLSQQQRVVLLETAVQPSCLRDTAGGVTCGFACVRGASGHVRCATTPDGACRDDVSGAVVCTAFSPQQRLYVGPPIEATCLKGANGHAACGYGCAAAKDGRARCSASPFGACGVGANGLVRCFPQER